MDTDLFRVIDPATGEPPNIKTVALMEDWAKGLMWTDMESFAVLADGTLALLDRFGNYAFCRKGRFRVEWAEAPK